MGFSFKNILKGLRLIPNSSDTTTQEGDIQVVDGINKVVFHNGTTSSPIVTETHASQGTNRLKNKDLEDASTSIVDSSDTTKKIQFNAGGTTGTKTTITGAQTADRVLTLPDTTDTLTANALAQTLTNKTIDADQNTITNIENADIKTGADIDRAKLASGNNYRLLANNSSGVMSENAALTPGNVPYVDANGQLISEAALDEVRGGTGLSSYSTGDTLYASGTNTLSKRSIGAAGTVWTSNGATPDWTSPAVSATISPKTANYTLLSTDDTIIGNASGGGFTLTLPLASSVPGKIYRLVRTDGTYANTITIARSGSDVFQRQGTTDTSLPINTVDESWELQSDGVSTWYVLNHRTNTSNIGFGTLTINGITLTNSNVTAYRRGNMLKIMGYAQITGISASVAYISLPSGIQLDSNHLSSVTDSQVVGSLYRYPDVATALPNTSTGPYVLFTDATGQPSRIYVSTEVSGAHFTYNQKNSNVIFNPTNEAISIECEFPVSGWLG